MSGRKRARETQLEAAATSDCPAKKRGVSKKTAEKWVLENDRELNTSVWLRFDADRDHVVALKCAVCTEFRDNLVGMRNYRSSFIDCSTNVRTSTFKEHAVTNMHARAMALFKKERSRSVFEYAPIAQSLANVSIDEGTTEVLQRKCEVAYFIAREKLAFAKMQPLCELEERHGVKLGLGYKNDHA